MKLDINEVFLAKGAIEGSTIKGSDARVVVGALDKLEKEFNRLELAAANQQNAK
jgi:hypothetical protein